MTKSKRCVRSSKLSFRRIHLG